MNTKHFGSAASVAALAFIAGAALGAGGAPKGKPAPSAPAKAAGKCVHNCAGYAQCKGNGNNSCKGKNDCANTGLVPKECSSQSTEDACKKVKDPKQSDMCTWYAS